MKKLTTVILVALVLSMLVGALAVFVSAKTDPAVTKPDVVIVDNTKIVDYTTYQTKFVTTGVKDGNGSYTVGDETVSYRTLTVTEWDHVDKYLAGDYASEGSNVTAVTNGGKYYNLAGGGLGAAYSNKFADGEFTRDYEYLVLSFDMSTESKYVPITIHGKAMTYVAEGENKGQNGSDVFIGGFAFDQNGVLKSNNSIKLSTVPYDWNRITLVIENATGVINLYVNDAYAASIDPIGANAMLRGFQSIRIEAGATAGYDTKNTADTADDVKTLIHGDPTGAGFCFTEPTLVAYTAEDGVSALFDGTYTNISDTYADGTKKLDIPTAQDKPAARPVATVDGVAYYDINEALEYVYTKGTNTTFITLNRSVTEGVTVKAPVKFRLDGGNGTGAPIYTITPDYDTTRLQRRDYNGISIFIAADTTKTYATVTFEADGKLADLLYSPVGTVEKACDAAIAKDGKRVVGWATSEGGEKVLDIGADFTVAEGVRYYAVWEEFAYSITTDTETVFGVDSSDFSANLVARGSVNATVDIYKDIAVSGMASQALILEKCSHVVNLHGCNLTVGSSKAKLYQVNPGGAIIFNGFDKANGEKCVVSSNGAQVCGNYGTATFNNVTLFNDKIEGNDKHYGATLVDFAGGTLILNGCTVDSDAAATAKVIGMRNSPTLKLYNCVLSATNSVMVTGTGATKTEMNGVTVTKPATFNLDAAATGNHTLTLAGNNDFACGSASPFGIPTTTHITFNITGEALMDAAYSDIAAFVPEGKVLLGLASGRFKITSAENAVRITLVVGDNTETLYFEKGAAFTYSVPSVSKIVDGAVYVVTLKGWKDAEGNAVTVTTEQDGTYYADIDTVPAAVAVFKADGEIAFATTDTVVSATVSEYGYLTEIYTDVTFTYTAAEYNLGVPAVIDLNGHTLTKNNYRYNLSKGFEMRSTSEERATVVNGGYSLIFGSGDITLKNLNVTTNKGVHKHTIDFRSKGYDDVVTIDNCSIVGGYNAVVFGQSSTGGQVIVKDSVLECTEGLGVGQHATYPPKYMVFDVTVTNTVFRTTDTAISVGKIPLGDGESVTDVTFIFDGCDFYNEKVYTAATAGVADATFTDCRFATAPRALDPDGNLTVSYGDKAVVKTTEAELPYRMVDASAVAAVSANLTLYTDFVLNFYLPAGTASATVNGNAAELVAFGEGYKVSADRVSALEVMNETVLAYTYKVGDLTVEDSVTYSVCDYATAVLNGDYAQSAKALIAGAVRYSAEVFNYTSTVADEKLVALLSLQGYTENVGELAEIPAGTADYTALADVVESVQLALGTTLKYKVNFKAGYTGTVNINGVDVEVTDGGSVNVVLRACDFNAGLVIKATVGETEVTGTYDLAAYYAGVKGTDAKLDALLVALYNYATAASSYLA